MAQRKGTVFTVLLGAFLAILFGALLAVVGSGSVAIAAAAPIAFSTQSECENAVLGGVYKVYSPKDFRSHTKNPVDGVKSVAVPTEFVACVLMDTTRGKKWVVQTPGTEFRFRVAEDGSLIQPPYARHDCGNKVYSISYPQDAVPDQPKVAAQEADTAEAPTKLSKAAQGLIPIRDVCGERGLFGDKFTNKIDERGRPYCEEDIPWYKTTTGVIVIGATAVGVGYCAVSGRCGFWKRGGGSVVSIPTGPSGGGTGIGEVISSGGGGIP